MAKRCVTIDGTVIAMLQSDQALVARWEFLRSSQPASRGGCPSCPSDNRHRDDLLRIKRAIANLSSSEVAVLLRRLDANAVAVLLPSGTGTLETKILS